MEIVVNHLTRMTGGHVCVAGIDVASQRHVRPVLRHGRLPGRCLSVHGGPFDVAVRVNLGAVTYVGKSPEVEDFEFILPKARAASRLLRPEFWDLLQKTSRPRLRDVFGDDLRKRGPASCGIDVGKGNVSLGCVREVRVPRVYVRPKEGETGQVRAELDDGEFNLDLGLTDVRFYGVDHATPDPRTVDWANDCLRQDLPLVVAVGVGRPPPAYHQSAHPPLHWLQINNLHFDVDPVWRLKQ